MIRSFLGSFRKFPRRDGDLNLANLPPDIIRKIIRLDGVSTDSLRQISPTWNALCCAYIQERKQHFPPAAVCQIRSKMKGRFWIQGWIQISLIVQPQETHAFKNWLAGWGGNVKDHEDGRIRIVRLWKFKGFGREIDCHDISFVFSRFRRIDQLHVVNCCERVRRIITSKLLRNIPINELCIFANDASAGIRKFSMLLAQKHQLERFFISTIAYSPGDTRKFLLTISKFVPSLWIAERYFDESMPPGDLFRIPGYYWKALANELVDNGVMEVRFNRGSQVIAEKWSPFRTMMYNAEF